MAQNDEEWERYQARLKFQRDQISYLQDAFERGFQEGFERGFMEEFEKGRKEGLEEGEAIGVIGSIHLCQRLLKLPLTPADELRLKSLQELRALAEMLQQQLGIDKPS